MIGINRTTLIRLENGQISDEHMKTITLNKIAIACSRESTFCCDGYHIFMSDDYGEKIRKLRKEKGWTQINLASQLGVHATTVKRWEKRRSRPSRNNYEEFIRLVQKEDM